MVPARKRARVSFTIDPEAESDNSVHEDGLSKGKAITFGIVKVNSVYSQDVLDLGAADAKIVPPLCEQLCARIETRKREEDNGIRKVVVVCLLASKPGFIMDHFVVCLSNSEFEVAVTAKIMSAGKGTPTLKDNVRSLGRLETEETDLE